MHPTTTIYKKIRFTLDKNFSYGYNDSIYNLRRSPNDVFQCRYTRASRIPRSFKEECIAVCEQISDYSHSVRKIPTILLSGGLDSEIVVRSFLESGREFRVVSNKFKNDLNDHEVDRILKFSKRYHIDLELKELDIINWLLRSDESHVLSHESKCIRPEMLPTMKLLSEVYKGGGIPVLGNGDLYASKEVNPNYRMNGEGEKYSWMYIEYEYILAWMRYSLQNNIIGSINFFQQTPEIVLSMILEPEIQNLIRNSPTGKQSTRSTKYEVYKKYYPDVEIRPKYHGMEKISNLSDFIRKSKLNRLYGEYNQKFKISMDDFTNLLMPL